MKYINLFDFDNTLFRTPEPSTRLWTPSTRNFIQSSKNFLCGSWWTYPRILESTGRGIEVEEAEGWPGWWNEDVVEAVRESMYDPESLTVLLTGRNEKFAEIVTRMVKAKGLNFDDLYFRTSQYSDTMSFKTEIINKLFKGEPDMASFVIYEDRPHHAHQFKDILDNLVKERNQYVYVSVVRVVSPHASLDPLVEYSLIQEMISSHNQSVKQVSVYPKGTFWVLRMDNEQKFTGYVLMPDSRELLLNTFNSLCIKAFQNHYQAPNLTSEGVPGGGSISNTEGKGNSLRKKVAYICTCAIVLQMNVSPKSIALILQTHLARYGDRVAFKVIGAGGYRDFYYIKVEVIPASYWQSIRDRQKAGEQDLGPPVPHGLCEAQPPPGSVLYIPFAAMVKKRVSTVLLPPSDEDDMDAIPKNSYNWVNYGPNDGPDGKPMILDTIFGDISQKKILMNEMKSR